MILNKFGQEFIYDGITYRIGDEIIGTDESEYVGLKGVIFEIRDGDDKDTENETPDIYCSFEDPVLADDIKKLEETFSDLYEEEMHLEDICLDDVIMAPSMITINCHTQHLSLDATIELAASRALESHSTDQPLVKETSFDH